jgi:hypothetical protein
MNYYHTSVLDFPIGTNIRRFCCGASGSGSGRNFRALEQSETGNFPSEKHVKY